MTARAPSPRCARRRAVGRVLLLVVLALAACSTPTYVYEKHGMTPATVDRDLEACRREAYRPRHFPLPGSPRIDPDEVNRCMERKGYRPIRVQ